MNTNPVTGNYSLIHNIDHFHNLAPTAPNMNSSHSSSQNDIEIIQGRQITADNSPKSLFEDLVVYICQKFDVRNEKCLMSIYILNTVFQIFSFLGFIGFIIAASII